MLFEENAAGLSFRWENCPAGARLLRVYGDTPCPALPAAIGGLPVAEIAPYCFADSPKAGGGGHLTGPGADTPGALHPLCGNFLTAVSLPGTVRVLHSAVFYNCRKLRQLRLGAALDGLGSDLFTNCTALEDFILTSEPAAPSGLKKLLGAISADITVRFCPDGAEQARLFYPEYTELLDENTPAHIFNHSIDGEGYRLRQCFTLSTLNFTEYDAAFPVVSIAEPPAKLCRLALGRLLYPYALAPEAGAAYRRYLSGHAADALSLVIALRDDALLTCLCAGSLLTPAAAQDGAARCARAGWSEGAARLLATGPRRAPKRYDFSDI